jgi:hypothetical protein
MSEEHPEGRKGFELRGWHVIVGLLAVLVVMFILFRVFGHSSLQRKIAELRAKGYPTSIEELEKYNQIPEGVPNAADLYVKAFDAYRAPFEDETKLLPYFRPGILKPGEPNAPEMEAMATFLSWNARTLELLHQAGQIEQCKFNYPLTSSSGFMNPYLNESKKCSQLLRILILERATSGKTDQSYQGMIDHLRLAESLSRESSLISYLVKISIEAGYVDSVQVILERTALSDQQIVELRAELLKARDQLRMGLWLVGERCYLLDVMVDRYPLGYGTIPARWSGLMDTNLVRSLEFFDQLEAAAKMEPEKRKKEFQWIDEEVNDLSVLFFTTKMLMPALGKVGMIELRIIAQLDCARTALGVGRFRLAEGRLPESLEALVPKFIEAVPIDPFDGKPLRYKRLEKGYTIYSVGEDGEDNGGISKSKVQKDEKFDLPFTVERE